MPRLTARPLFRLRWLQTERSRRAVCSWRAARQAVRHAAVDGSSDKVAGRGRLSVTTGHRLSKREFRHAEGLPDGPVRFWAVAHTSSPELLILHGLRVKGMADEAAVAERFALDCDLVRSRRANAGQDLTSKLLRAEVDGERLEDHEIVGFVGLLLLAGHITTTATLGNTIVSLEENPDAATEIRADPSLLPAAIEEVLRYRTPFPRARPAHHHERPGR